MLLASASKCSFGSPTASTANAGTTILKPSLFLNELREETDQSVCYPPDPDYRNLGFLADWSEAR